MELKLTQRKDRGNVFYIEGEIFGAEVRESTFCKEEAEAELVYAQFVDKKKREFLGSDLDEVTFNEVAYRHTIAETKKTVDKDLEYIETLKPYIGKLPFNKITRIKGIKSPLDPFIKLKALQKRSITTVNKHISFINTLGNKGRDDYKMLKTWNEMKILQPNEGKKLGLKPKQKKRHLTREMETLLLNHLPEYLREPVIMSINTGFREAMLCGLKWEWLHKDSDTVWYFDVPMEEMKTEEYIDDDQVFVLNSIAREIVKSRQSNGSEYVFPHPDCPTKGLSALNVTSYRTARVRGALQIPALRKTDVHSFRRTFATRLREQMVPHEFIQRLLGHVFENQTEEYIRCSEKVRRRYYDYVELIVGDEKAVPLRLFASN